LNDLQKTFRKAYVAGSSFDKHFFIDTTSGVIDVEFTNLQNAMNQSTFRFVSDFVKLKYQSFCAQNTRYTLLIFNYLLHSAVHTSHSGQPKASLNGTKCSNFKVVMAEA